MKTNFLKMLITGVDNEDDFREIQEKLFKYGYEWGSIGKDFINYWDYKTVLVERDGKMWTSGSTYYKDYRKVTVERFLDKDFIGQKEYSFYVSDFLGEESFNIVQDILFSLGYSWYLDCFPIKRSYNKNPFIEAIKINNDTNTIYPVNESHNYGEVINYEADWFIQNYKTILNIKDSDLIKGAPVPSQDLRDAPIKKMNTNGILNFVKDTFLTSDQREMKKAGILNEYLKYTEDALELVKELKAKSLGYKDFKEIESKVDSMSISALEREQLYTEFHNELVECAIAYNKSQEKKRK